MLWRSALKSARRSASERAAALFCPGARLKSGARNRASEATGAERAGERHGAARGATRKASRNGGAARPLRESGAAGANRGDNKSGEAADRLGATDRRGASGRLRATGLASRAGRAGLRPDAKASAPLRGALHGQRKCVECDGFGRAKGRLREP